MKRPGFFLLKTHEVVLESQRLVMRRLTADDGLLLYDLDKDPRVMAYITHGVGTSLDKIEREILPRWLRLNETHHHGFFPTHRRDSGQFIGWFHLKPMRDKPSLIDLGYRLSYPNWNDGLATEGARALVKQSFLEWHESRITAHAIAANVVSRRSWKRRGLSLKRSSSTREDSFPRGPKKKGKGSDMRSPPLNSLRPLFTPL